MNKQRASSRRLERDCVGVGAIITNDKTGYTGQLKAQGLNLNLPKVLGLTPIGSGNNATSTYYSLNINPSPPWDTVFGN